MVLTTGGRYQGITTGGRYQGSQWHNLQLAPGRCVKQSGLQSRQSQDAAAGRELPVPAAMYSMAELQALLVLKLVVYKSYSLLG